MVCYPCEWERHMFKSDPNRDRCFKKETPADIIKEARAINEKYIKISGNPFFSFEEDEDKDNH